MQFDFSDDQKELRASVRRFLEDRCPSSVVRAVIASETSFSPALWREVSDSGFLAAAIPESHGGAGAGYLELCVVAEECGRAMAPLPTTTSIYQVTELLRAAGSHDQQAQWLPALARGEQIGTVAFVERAGELTPRSIATRHAGGALTGIKIPVVDGMDATLAVVMAREQDAQEPDALSLFLVDLADAGVSRSPLRVIDPSRKAARIVLDGAPAERLGEAGAGWAIFEAVRDRAAILTAFEQIGGAEAALFMARDYALERYAFGRQIGSFQAIKHMLADVYVAIEIARANAYYGAWALSVDSERLPAAAASARVAATRAYQLSSAANIQVHGGMGFTWEFDCHLHYRRSNHLAVTLGGPSLWERRVIEQGRLQAPAMEGRSNEL